MMMIRARSSPSATSCSSSTPSSARPLAPNSRARPSRPPPSPRPPSPPSSPAPSRPLPPPHPPSLSPHPTFPRARGTSVRCRLLAWRLCPLSPTRISAAGRRRTAFPEGTGGAGGAGGGWRGGGYAVAGGQPWRRTRARARMRVGPATPRPSFSHSPTPPRGGWERRPVKRAPAAAASGACPSHAPRRPRANPRRPKLPNCGGSCPAAGAPRAVARTGGPPLFGPNVAFQGYAYFIAG
jgi:hypothetical protein